MNQPTPRAVLLHEAQHPGPQSLRLLRVLFFLATAFGLVFAALDGWNALTGTQPTVPLAYSVLAFCLGTAATVTFRIWDKRRFYRLARECGISREEADAIEREADDLDTD